MALKVTLLKGLFQIVSDYEKIYNQVEMQFLTL